MNTMMRLLAQAPTKMHASVGQWAPCVYGTLLAASTESAADTALDVLEKYCEETRGPWPVLRNIMYPEIESKIVPYMAKTYGTQSMPCGSDAVSFPRGWIPFVRD